MIKELLEINNIRYVISVDDCYLGIDEHGMKAELFADMMASFSKYEKLIKDMGKEPLLIETKEMLELSNNNDALINNFLDEFTEKELKQLYELTSPILNSAEEKDKLINFLNGLKNNGDIEDFKTLSSAKDASEYKCAGKDTEGILWLIDINFERSGEAKEAGFQLARSIIGREEGPANYVYFLSQVFGEGKGEDEEEKEFDTYLKGRSDLKESSSLIYYLPKQKLRLDNPDKFAKALAKGFMRKACYELFKLYILCMQDSLKEASAKLYDIRQDTLNYLFDELIKNRGESVFEFMGRFVEIFQSDSYQNAVAENFEKIAEKVDYYKKIGEIAQIKTGNQKEQTEVAKKFRKSEIYNYHINRQHLEISTGDIFKIGGKYYFLASQSCDTCLRKDGYRNLEEANLLSIDDDGSTSPFTHKLSCFEEHKKPAINFRSQITFPFEILDLCVLNDNGLASVELACLKDSDVINNRYIFTERFQIRLKHIFSQFTEILENHEFMKSIFTNGDSNVDIKEIEKAYCCCKEANRELLKYTKKESELCYDVQRICRLEELISVDVVNKFGAHVSRIGHPFDYTDKEQ